MLKSLRRIHNDEQGLETLQVVMIIAIAAVILVLVNAMWGNTIKPWFNKVVAAVTGFFA